MSTSSDDRLGPLGRLVGTWAGSGHGVYPTIEPFDYLEEIDLVDPGGKPFVAYSQRTRSTDGRPLHAEVGYVRWTGGAVELVVAQPSGVTEAHRGQHREVDGRLELEFSSVAVGLTPAAKRVDTVWRRLVIDGDELAYELWMGAVGQPHQLHLEATLHRRV